MLIAGAVTFVEIAASLITTVPADAANDIPENPLTRVLPANTTPVPVLAPNPNEVLVPGCALTSTELIDCHAVTDGYCACVWSRNNFSSCYS